MSGTIEERSLAEVFEAAHHNTRYTHAVQPKVFEKLQALHKLYADFIGCLNNVRRSELVPFVLASHAAFLSASFCSTSGMLPAAHSVSRSVIESAGYCVLIWKNDGMYEEWLLHKDNSTSTAKMKRTLSTGKIAQALGELDRQYPEYYRKLEQIANYNGSHPNVATIYTNTEIESGPGFRRTVLNYFNHDTPFFEFAAQQVVRCGVLALLLFERVWLTRARQSGITARVSGASRNVFDKL